MNPEVKRDQPMQQEPKSKRLSSLLWIFVLWGGVRACSEMDGISWKRAFPSDAIVFGLYPATLFLVLAIVSPIRQYERVLRWSALVSVLGSVMTIFFFDQQSRGVEFIAWWQRIWVVAVVLIIAIHWAIKGSKR